MVTSDSCSKQSRLALSAGYHSLQPAMVKTLKCLYPGDSKASLVTVEAGVCFSGQLSRSLVPAALQTLPVSKAQSFEQVCTASPSFGEV